MMATAVLTELPTFPNGEIDWERLVRSYAADNGQKYGDALLWLSKRDTVLAAIQLLGIEVDGPNMSGPKSTDYLNSFAKFLDKHGYAVPKLWEYGIEKYLKGSATRLRAAPQVVDAPAALAATDRVMEEPRSTERYVLIRVPIRPEIETTELVKRANLSRAQAFDIAYYAMCECVAWTYNDLMELMGTDDVTEQVQRYVERQIG